MRAFIPILPIGGVVQVALGHLFAPLDYGLSRDVHGGAGVPVADCELGVVHHSYLVARGRQRVEGVGGEGDVLVE